MTTKRKTSEGKTKAKNLKLKKETVRDLGVKGRSGKIGGGAVSGGCPSPVPIPYPSGVCTQGCPLVTFVCVTNGCVQR